MHYRFHVTPLVERYLHHPIVRLVEHLAWLAPPIQSGDMNLHLSDSFIAILIACAVEVNGLVATTRRAYLRLLSHPICRRPDRRGEGRGDHALNSTPLAMSQTLQALTP